MYTNFIVGNKIKPYNNLNYYYRPIYYSDKHKEKVYLSGVSVIVRKIFNNNGKYSILAKLGEGEDIHNLKQIQRTIDKQLPDNEKNKIKLVGRNGMNEYFIQFMCDDDIKDCLKEYNEGWINIVVKGIHYLNNEISLSVQAEIDDRD